jgi:hypothetical protein
MTIVEIAVPIVLALLGGGGIWALFKIRPEAGMVTVLAAEKVVLIQSGEIVRLEESVAECRNEAKEATAEARTSRAALRELTTEVQSMRQELIDAREGLGASLLQRDALKDENVGLTAQVVRLEARVRELERRTPGESTPGGGTPVVS